jgi:hypothetical protein
MLKNAFQRLNNSECSLIESRSFRCKKNMIAGGSLPGFFSIAVVTSSDQGQFLCGFSLNFRGFRGEHYIFSIGGPVVHWGPNCDFRVFFIYVDCFARRNSEVAMGRAGVLRRLEGCLGGARGGKYCILKALGSSGKIFTPAGPC